MKVQHEQIYKCNDTVFALDVNQREITKHGTDEFPCVSYLDKYYNSSYPWHWHDEMELAYVEIGISPIQYTIDLRVQKACELLAESSLSLIEICESCGFQDQSYFVKVFREKIGIPPCKWRKESVKTKIHPIE